MNEDDSEQAELQPGDLTADELVRLHRDLDPGPSDVGYASRWRDWQSFVGRIDDTEQRARVAAYIEEHFDPPNDERIAGTAAALEGVRALTQNAGGTAATAPTSATTTSHESPGHAGPIDATGEAAAGRAPRRRRTGRYVGTAVVVAAVIGVGVAVAANRSSSDHKTINVVAKRKTTTTVQVRFISLHAKVLSTIRGAHCSIQQTWRYANATPNVNIAGKVAVIEGNGSVEGIRRIVVPASQSFVVTFIARVERGNGPGACTSRLGVFPLTVAGLPAGIGR